MSKKMYVEPEVSIIALNQIDIIASSADPFDGIWVPIGRQSDDAFFPTE